MRVTARPAEIHVTMRPEPRHPPAASKAGFLDGCEARVRTIVEAAQEGVWLFDTEGRTTFVSTRMAGLLQQSAEDLVGRPVVEFLDPAHRGGLPVEPTEVRLHRADGSWLLGLISSRPLIDDEGEWTGTVAMVTDITAAKNTEATLLYESYHDPLTGLPNRALFLERLDHALRRRAPHGSGMAVLVVDIDRFRWVYDSLGPTGANQLLEAVAGRLKSAVRPSDTVARIGGDEYAVLCDQLDDPEEAMAVAVRVASCISAPFTLGDHHFSTTASVGATFVTVPAAMSAEIVLRDAETAVETAKKAGGDRVEIFDDEQRAQALGRVETERALRAALALGQLEVHYQPVVELASLRVVGLEALVRWRHPERGLVQPVEFVPLAEETGLIVSIGASVLRTACNDVAAWNQSHPNRPPMTVAVNLSARQLVSSELTESVAATLRDSGLPPGLLCLEITESVLMEDGPASRAALLALKNLGVMLAVDDFGTGYSSLLYLRQYPVDLLKVDRSFVSGLGRDPQDSAIVAGVVGLAQGLELATVAEGVETSEQAFRLTELGCQLAQGFHWSRPLPRGELYRWLDDFALPADAGPRPLQAVAGARRTRVVLADDQHHVREAVRTVLDLEGSFEVVAEAGNGWEAVEMTRRHQPDLVVLDLLMPGMGGAQALPHLLAASPRTKVVVLTSLDMQSIDLQAFAGVAGCLEKSADLSTIGDQLSRLVPPAA